MHVLGANLQLPRWCSLGLIKRGGERFNIHEVLKDALGNDTLKFFVSL